MHIAPITLALSNGRRAEPVSYRSQMQQIALKMWTILLLVLVGTAINASGEKFNLLDVQDQDGNDVNTVASPFGLWALMNCLAMGAAKNTLAQIQNAFELPATSEGIAQKYKGLSLSLRECPDCANITSHNYILHDNKMKIKASYAAVMAKDFDATVKGLDFSSPSVADEANEEVKKKQNLTSTPFAKDDFVGQMVLANAVTFQGAWWSTFESTSTTLKPFHDTNGKAIGNVNMMFQQQYFQLSNIHVLNAAALEMPYGYGDKYSMVIVLPNPGGSVKEVRTNLAKTSLKTILESLKQAPRTEVLTEVPRFKIVSSANLNDKLKNAGVTDMFSPGADFSNIGGGLVVSKVTQDALIEVTEAGTKAEAVTEADVYEQSSGMPEPPPRVFRADRPFVFLIVNKIKETVIFEGQYVSPSLS